MNRFDNKEKKRRGGCLSWILGTVLVIVGVVVYAIVSSLINRWLIGARFGQDAACALLPLAIPGLTVAFVLYEAIFIVRLIKSGNKQDDAKAKRIANVVTIAAICLSLLFAVFSANTFTQLDNSSISKVCFVQTKQYVWDQRCDVQRYSVSCSSEGALSYVITMKDGETVELWNSVNSCSSEFLEKYGDIYGYAAYLSEQFDNSEFIIEKRVTGVEFMEKFYKTDKPEVWASLEKIISDTQ